MANPRNKSPERASILQSYMVLHMQQEKIRKRLSSSSPSPTTSPRTSMSEGAQQSFSPRRRGSSFTDSTPPTFPSNMFSSPNVHNTINPIPEEAVSDSSDSETLGLSVDQDSLYDINKQIKTTLTDLLNCESVKHDGSGKFRLWIQSRLMEAEKELKKQKRRRISGGSEQADAIGASFDEDVVRRISL
ncbi:hypothetical protein LTR66_002130 [Elasticomyces elasticus]|nr:hypothetical protein LTR50_001527 [Elasticomyces elasticus]KAK4998701.1 hypothetical protein LTR66_002130 [Elasticomyces elasticus]